MKKIRFLSLFLIFILITQVITPCFATESSMDASENSEAEESLTEAEEPQTDTPVQLTEYNFAVDYEPRAKAAILVELSTNTIVYGKELDKKIYPASLTKIMTCMLALEYGNPEDIVTVSATALENLSEYGSTANLQKGEKLTLRELLYCIMISSANEGCNVIAEHISGSVEEFVSLMNQKAKELGMDSTRYANTHGLHNDNHYTTIRDLAVLSCWAWAHDDFREYATTTVHTVPATNLSDERILHTTNYLISDAKVQKYYYSKASGVKTGFTTPAGGCLVSTASDQGFDYLCIVCGCETLIESDGGELDMRFVESKRLFEYAFENYAFVQVLSDTQMLGQPNVTNAAGRGNVVVHSAANASVIMPKNYSAAQIIMNTKFDSTQALSAPLAAGQRVGTVTATYQGIQLVTADLVTLTAVESAIQDTEPELPSKSPVQVSPAEEEQSSFFRYWYLTFPLLILLVFVVILIVSRAYNNYQAKQRAKRRREREERRRQRYGR